MPETKGDGKKQLTLKEKRMRALKIGAAAAGGGALLAITGTFICGVVRCSTKSTLSAAATVCQVT